MSQPSLYNLQDLQAIQQSIGNSYTSNTCNGTSNTTISNQYLNNFGGYNNVVDETKEMIEYMDFTFQILGIDIDFVTFRNMSSGEKKSFLRDIKINKLLC